jgi:leukotriene-A4 hydrolase
MIPSSETKLTSQGFHFLYYLEKLLTKPAFDRFIPHYFTTWQKKSLDSYEFKSTLLSFFASDATASKALAEVDWDTWFYKPGLPPKPKFDTSMVDKCYALAEKWEAASEVSSCPPSTSACVRDYFIEGFLG